MLLVAQGEVEEQVLQIQFQDHQLHTQEVVEEVIIYLEQQEQVDQEEVEELLLHVVLQEQQEQLILEEVEVEVMKALVDQMAEPVVQE
jgi:hypothetical protein